MRRAPRAARLRGRRATALAASADAAGGAAPRLRRYRLIVLRIVSDAWLR